jgi:hypothetical protein
MRRTAVAMALVAAVGTASCGGEQGVEEWSAGWAAARASVPPLDVLQSQARDQACSTALGDTRQWVADLEHAPNMDIGDAFLDWAEFAEAIFQECPINSGPYAGFEASYQELHRLAAEVEALLEFERELSG